MLLDAEKAFDRVSWAFMMELVEQMEFGTDFLGALKSIYKDQKPLLIVNGAIVGEISISKGTRQGCPLSPLIFILALEVLNNQIREDPAIAGIRVGKRQYKLKAYADDLIITMENPNESVRRILEVIDDYGMVSGFKLNKIKMKLLAKNMDENEKKKIERTSGLKFYDRAKYLGIYISKNNINLYSENYVPVWRSIKEKLDKWNNLNLSFLGRIAVVKMMVLPKTAI